MTYEAVIGVEVHAQLRTATKLFCGCTTTFGLAPNTQCCPVCIGMPGSLPVLNKRAVELAIRAGLALNCTIRLSNRFARKNYFYPDLPKGYQISQYEAPICESGSLDITTNGHAKTVRIRRAHLEEDAGKNLHEGDAATSRVDFNRAGTPLLEIVTEPDLSSPEEVDAYLRALRDILKYLDACDGNMEQGSFRCEPNISVRPAGSSDLGTKVELKNINSFRFVKQALAYEIARQTKVLASGGVIHQETRLWDPEREVTVVMRSKEEAHDYRYFPDPDLLPVEISQEWIQELRQSLPELPAARAKRFVHDYRLPEYDASVLTASKDLADYFEACVRLFPNPKIVSNWVMGELLRELNARGIPAQRSPVSPECLAKLLQLVDEGTISLKIAREIFPELYASGKDPETLVHEKGLTQISDAQVLEQLVEEVMRQHPAQVDQYRRGKEAVLGFFVGQVMKASGGKANPGKVNELLRRKLASDTPSGS
ncbi:MAG: Asp-tRNA(Asn)/Glu-tRNA(Gln) amidotransferase subunit GatB [Nitrospirae bacterium]|nr:MAG: Asp-tRNA(Asn)/Glu-tRNA(Gln) amidotransferase subunit GatB [Nitrospirota bacterium]